MLTAFAEDVVAAHSSVTDRAWELAGTLQEVQASTTDHVLCLSCIYSQPFLLHCFSAWFKGSVTCFFCLLDETLTEVPFNLRSSLTEQTVLI